MTDGMTAATDLDKRLVELLQARSRPLQVVVDGDGRVLEISGEADYYGYAGLRRGAAIDEQVPIVLGMTELPEFDLESVETPSGRSADVCWRLEDGRGVLRFFDATAARAAIQDIQQTANDSQILQYRLKQLTEQLRRKQQELMYIAYHDALTGLYNRRQFVERLPEEIGRARADGSYLSLMLIDIDHFKLYNDRYGHLFGDRCLSRVASVIGAAATGAHEMAARVGGEEFAVLLPGVALTDARARAQALCVAVQAQDIEHASSSHKVVTLSIGVAQLRGARDDPSWELLYKDSDTALYEAKSTGRNRVAVAASAN